MKQADVDLALERIRATLMSLQFVQPDQGVRLVFDKLVAPYLAQLAEQQTQLEQLRRERDAAHKALRLRELEETGLYDMHGQPYD